MVTEVYIDYFSGLPFDMHPHLMLTLGDRMLLPYIEVAIYQDGTTRIQLV